MTLPPDFYGRNKKVTRCNLIPEGLENEILQWARRPGEIAYDRLEEACQSLFRPGRYYFNMHQIGQVVRTLFRLWGLDGSHENGPKYNYNNNDIQVRVYTFGSKTSLFRWRIFVCELPCLEEATANYKTNIKIYASSRYHLLNAQSTKYIADTIAEQVSREARTELKSNDASAPLAAMDEDDNTTKNSDQQRENSIDKGIHACENPTEHSELSDAPDDDGASDVAIAPSELNSPCVSSEEALSSSNRATPWVRDKSPQEVVDLIATAAGTDNSGIQKGATQPPSLEVEEQQLYGHLNREAQSDGAENAKQDGRNEHIVMVCPPKPLKQVRGCIQEGQDKNKEDESIEQLVMQSPPKSRELGQVSMQEAKAANDGGAADSPDDTNKIKDSVSDTGESVAITLRGETIPPAEPLFVWVRFKDTPTDHQALLLNETDKEVFVKWTTAGNTEWVTRDEVTITSDADMTGGRRGRRSRKRTTTQEQPAKKAAKNQPAKATKTVTKQKTDTPASSEKQTTDSATKPAASVSKAAARTLPKAAPLEVTDDTDDSKTRDNDDHASTLEQDKAKGAVDIGEQGGVPANNANSTFWSQEDILKLSPRPTLDMDNKGRVFAYAYVRLEEACQRLFGPDRSFASSSILKMVISTLFNLWNLDSEVCCSIVIRKRNDTTVATGSPPVARSNYHGSGFHWSIVLEQKEENTLYAVVESCRVYPTPDINVINKTRADSSADPPPCSNVSHKTRADSSSAHPDLAKMVPSEKEYVPTGSAIVSTKSPLKVTNGDNDNVAATARDSAARNIVPRTQAVVPAIFVPASTISIAPNKLACKTNATTAAPAAPRKDTNHIWTGFTSPPQPKCEQREKPAVNTAPTRRPLHTPPSLANNVAMEFSNSRTRTTSGKPRRCLTPHRVSGKKTPAILAMAACIDKNYSLFPILMSPKTTTPKRPSKSTSGHKRKGATNDTSIPADLQQEIAQHKPRKQPHNAIKLNTEWDVDANGKVKSFHRLKQACQTLFQKGRQFRNSEQVEVVGGALFRQWNEHAKIFSAPGLSGKWFVFGDASTFKWCVLAGRVPCPTDDPSVQKLRFQVIQSGPTTNNISAKISKASSNKSPVSAMMKKPTITPNEKAPGTTGLKTTEDPRTPTNEASTSITPTFSSLKHVAISNKAGPYPYISVNLDSPSSFPGRASPYPNRNPPTKEISEVYQASKLCASLSGLLFSDRYSDIKVKCKDGATFSAHKNILATTSSAWDEFFQSNHLKDSFLCLDYHSKVVKEVLRSIYTGTLDRQVLLSNLSHFHCLAKDHQLEALHEHVLDVTRNVLTVGNLKCYLLQFWNAQNQILLDICMNYVRSHGDAVLISPSLSSIAEKHSRLWNLVFEAATEGSGQEPKRPRKKQRVIK